MTLSKLEMQQMLREMNVKFSADESYQELKQRLQQENHALWLKSVAAKKDAGGHADQVVVRKRSKTSPTPESASDWAVPPAETSQERQPRSPTTTGRKQSLVQNYHRQTIEKPAPGKPWKEAANGTEPFNRKKKVFATVLRRARMCCEGCDQSFQEASGQPQLEPFHIVPLDQGGEHSIKNVVALCPACLTAVQSQPDPKMIKTLKKKTRGKIYDSLKVVRKHNVRRRKS